MKVVGLDPALAARHPEMAALYPDPRIVVIPHGYERVFGERFADYTLDRASQVLRTERTGQSSLSEAELFETLADIWNPTRYAPFDNAGDGEIQAQRAASRMVELTSKVV